jgi:hypothetical protein
VNWAVGITPGPGVEVILKGGTVWIGVLFRRGGLEIGLDGLGEPEGRLIFAGSTVVCSMRRWEGELESSCPCGSWDCGSGVSPVQSWRVYVG